MFINSFKISEDAEHIRIVTAPVHKITDPLHSLFLSSIKKAQRGKNSTNFSEIMFPMHEQTAVSLAIFKNRCIAFSSIWNRKGFWGNSIYRIANRTWYDSSYRVTVLSRKTPNIFIIKTMLHQQLRFIERISTTYIAFVSREGDKRKYLKWFSKKVSIPSNVYNDLYLVCPNRTSPSCWHTIASFQKGNIFFPFEKLIPGTSIKEVV